MTKRIIDGPTGLFPSQKLRAGRFGPPTKASIPTTANPETFKELTDQQLEQALNRRTGSETFGGAWFAKRAAVAAKSRPSCAPVDEFARPVTLEMGKLIARPWRSCLSADIIDY